MSGTSTGFARPRACMVHTRWRLVMCTRRKAVRHSALVMCVCNRSITRVRPGVPPSADVRPWQAPSEWAL